MMALPSAIPCVLFAVRRESLFFRRARRPLRRVHSAPCAAFLCGPATAPVLVVETGVGRNAANVALDWALRGPELPSRVVYAGFAGALDPRFVVGDVLIAEEVVDERDRRWPTTWDGPRPRTAPWLRSGRLLTASQLIAMPAEKRRLGQRWHAQAVDMEAAYAADHCARRGIPFQCVRAISDAVDTALSSALTTLLCGGRVTPGRALVALFLKPSLAAEFWRLGRDTHLAARRLATTLESLLPVPALRGSLPSVPR